VGISEGLLRHLQRPKSRKSNESKGRSGSTKMGMGRLKIEAPPSAEVGFVPKRETGRGGSGLEGEKKILSGWRLGRWALGKRGTSNYGT